MNDNKPDEQLTVECAVCKAKITHYFPVCQICTENTRTVSPAVPPDLAQAIADRDELSKTIETCHKMLDEVDEDYEEGTTALTPLDTRLREYIWPTGRITDDMVNGDD